MGIVAKSLKEKGYFQMSDFLEPEELALIPAELKENIKKNYNPESLEANSVYMSDTSDTRESHAFMISRMFSTFPTVSLIGPMLKSCFNVADELISLADREVPGRCRYMINFQNYKGVSKPVPSHFDGHYIKYDKLDNGGFDLIEGILPQFVMVLNVSNENTEGVRGVQLTDQITGETISPDCEPGSAVIFDNIRMRHWVPQLEKPRLMLGFRNFDHNTYHFLKETTDPAYTKMPGKDSLGFVKPLSMEENAMLLKNYYENIWPEQWKKMQEEGAVF